MAKEQERSGVEPQYQWSGTPTYGMLNPEKEGMWSVISRDGASVGLIWADYAGGAGVVFSVDEDDETKRVVNLVNAAFSMGLSPVRMFSTITSAQQGSLVFSPGELGMLSDIPEIMALESEDLVESPEDEGDE